MSTTSTQYTRLLFSGSGIAIENYLRKHPEEFQDCGILLSYFYLTGEKVADVDVRRLKKMIRGVPFTSKNPDTISERLKL